MKRTSLIFAATLSMLAGGLILAQPGSSADAPKPASSNVPGQQYPQIDTELHGTFRVSASNAQSVVVKLASYGNLDLAKDSNGLWSGTTSKPMAPGFHYYSVVIDGMTTADPASESFFGMGRMASGIEVPSKGEDFYEPRDVPHGEVRSIWYYSKITGHWRRCFVYTPPDYDSNTTARYPVLYLQPGFGEDERGWETQGRAGLRPGQNLIETGKAKPMLAVMDNQFTALKPGEAPLILGGRRGGAGPRPDLGHYGATFTEVMLTELIPMD